MVHALDDFPARTPLEHTERGRTGQGVVGGGQGRGVSGEGQGVEWRGWEWGAKKILPFIPQCFQILPVLSSCGI